MGLARMRRSPKVCKIVGKSLAHNPLLTCFWGPGSCKKAENIGKMGGNNPVAGTPTQDMCISQCEDLWPVLEIKLEGGQKRTRAHLALCELSANKTEYIAR